MVTGIDSGDRRPVAWSRLEVGGHSIRLSRPSDPDRLLDDPEVLAMNVRDDYMPYWAYLWPGAFLLAEAVSREPWEPGTVALEIGCGLGLSGLIGLAAGLDRVVFTDYDRAPLRHVARSAEANGFGPDRVDVAPLDWRAPPSASYPVILGADVLYERRLVPMVVGLLDAMLAPDGFALVSGPYRVASEDLAPALDRSGLHLESGPITARDESGHALKGTLHRIWKSTRNG